MHNGRSEIVPSESERNPSLEYFEMQLPLTTEDSCYAVVCRRLTTELLSLMVVMSEGLGFNLCVVPFLNVCVLNLPQRVGGGGCQRWLELGWRCHTRVKWKETKLDHSEDGG